MGNYGPIEDFAALLCRTAGEATGQNGAAPGIRVCIGGRLLPAWTEAPAACRGCMFRPESTIAGCCMDGLDGWRAVPISTHRHLLGFLLLGPAATPSPALGPTPPATLAMLGVITAVAALVLENRDLRQRLERADARPDDGCQAPGAPETRPRPLAGTAATKAEPAVRWPATAIPELLTRALEQSPAAIIITNPAGIIEYANPGFVKASGYQPHEVIGRDPSLLKSGLTPPEEYRAIWAIIAGGGTWCGEFHNRRKDGALYWVTASISPVRDGSGAITHYLAVEEDISEIKALQARLSRSEERYRGASEASLDGLFILDAIRDEAGSLEDFRFVEANAEGCALVGRDRAQIVGQPLGSVLPPERARDLIDKYRRVFLHRDVLNEQFEVADNPVQPLWIHHTAVPLDTGVAVTARNITEIKRYEAALKAARAAAEDANNAKSAFLATMSHELRTPLNAILGFSELIRDQTFGPINVPRYIDYAGNIHASGRHLLELITSILDISKIEAGKLEIELRPVDLPSLLQECMALVRNRAETQKLLLTADLAHDLPTIWADERALRQIMLNLLTNAIKFTPNGGTVTVGAKMAGPDWLDLSVTDTGIGIPEDQLARVMKPFEQLDNSYTRSAGGTGLGLALVKALIELHGGTVTLTSAPGHGTTALVHLPRHGPRQTVAASWLLSLDKPL